MKSHSEMRHNVSMIVMRLFVLSTLLLFSQLSLAEEESWYQVEIVVFERPYPDLDGEQWLIAEYQPGYDRLELEPADELTDIEEPVPFSLLPASSNRLDGVEKVFRLSSSYNPLLHYSWQQPATERRDARFVKIQKLVEDTTGLVSDTVETDAEPEFIEALIEPDRIVDGAIRIRSGFYLHVDVDLNYFTALPQENRLMQTAMTDEQPDPFATSPVQLKETRKIKLNEIHYFDHPMFGLIIQVSRLNQS